MSCQSLRTLLLFLALTLALVSPAAAEWEETEFTMAVGEARPFAPVDLSEYDRMPYANTGWFGSFDVVGLFMNSPDRTTIGATNVIPRPAVFYGAPNPMQEFNSVDTGDFRTELHNGNDVTIGYTDAHAGFFLRFLELNGHRQRLSQESNVGMVLADPQGLLTGFFDFDGDGIDDTIDGDLIFGRDFLGAIGIIDFGDIVPQGILFEGFRAEIASKDTYFIEANRTWRANRCHFGGYFETFAGVRYVNFEETFVIEGIRGLLADTRWDTEARNNIVGPQIGARWFRRQGRTTIELATQFVPALNFQTIRQRSDTGSRLTQIFASVNPAVGSVGGQDINVPGGSTRSRFDAFLRQGNTDSEHFTEFSPVLEVTGKASILLTKSVALRLGTKVIYVDGIARPSSMVDYTFPAFGIRDGNNTEHLILAGAFVGVEVNR